MLYANTITLFNYVQNLSQNICQTTLLDVKQLKTQFDICLENFLNIFLLKFREIWRVEKQLFASQRAENCEAVL